MTAISLKKAPFRLWTMNCPTFKCFRGMSGGFTPAWVTAR